MNPDSTPPPVPPSFIPPVLPYANPLGSRPREVDPRLRFISRLSIWLGVLFTVIGGFALLIGLLMIVSTRVIDYDELFFLGVLLLSSLVTACGSITLLVAAKTVRSASLTAARVGGWSLLLGLLSASALFAYNCHVTGKYDALVAVVVLLGFAGICIKLLLSCAAYERVELM